ncbi:MAG: hypothetical protein SGILL_009500, partial [Bacillariaceae sp.]
TGGSVVDLTTDSDDDVPDDGVEDKDTAAAVAAVTPESSAKKKRSIQKKNSTSSKKPKPAPASLPTFDSTDLIGERVNIRSTYVEREHSGKVIASLNNDKWRVQWKSQKAKKAHRSTMTREEIQACHKNGELPQDLLGVELTTKFSVQTNKHVLYPATIVSASTRNTDHWVVKYDGYSSDDNGEFSRVELENAMNVSNSGTNKKGESNSPKGLSGTAIKTMLCQHIGADEHVVQAVLGMLAPPYDWNIVWEKLEEVRQQATNTSVEICPGLRLRKKFPMENGHDRYYQGEIIGEAADDPPRWNVQWSDGTINVIYRHSAEPEPLDVQEVHRFHHKWQNMKKVHAVHGRKLNCLELFSGTGTVAKMFEMLSIPGRGVKWNVESVDSHDKRASIFKSIFDLTLKDLSVLPDFCWASPVCTSMSRAAGGTHRAPLRGKYCKTTLAEESDYQLYKLFSMLRFFLRHNPDFLFVIENPVGGMGQLPFIKAMEHQMNLRKVTVEYCRFGEKYQKPTNLWTNVHPQNFQRDKSEMEMEKIPDQLAAFVAAQVDAIQTSGSRQVHKKSPIMITPQLEEEFDSLMQDPVGNDEDSNNENDEGDEDDDDDDDDNDDGDRKMPAA